MKVGKWAAMIGKLAVMGIVFFWFLAPSGLWAREKRGAWVVVEKTGGGLVAGELLSVKADSLVVMGEGSGSIVRADEIVCLRIVNKSKALPRMAAGFFSAAALGFLMGVVQGNDKETGWFHFSATEKGAFWAMFLCPVGGLVGLASGMASGKDEKFELKERAYPSLIGILNRHCRFPETAAAGPGAQNAGRS